MAYLSNHMKLNTKLSQIINEDEESVNLSIEIVPDHSSTVNLTQHLEEINRRNFIAASSGEWQELLARLNSVRRVQNDIRIKHSSKAAGSDQLIQAPDSNSDQSRVRSPMTVKQVKQSTPVASRGIQTQAKPDKRRVKLVPLVAQHVCANKHCVYSVIGQTDVKQLKRVHEGQIQSFCSSCAKAISKKWVCFFCQRIFIPVEQSRTADGLTWIGCDSKGCTRWTHLECVKAQGTRSDSQSKFYCHDCESEPDFMRPLGVKVNPSLSKQKDMKVELPGSHRASDHKSHPREDPSTRSTHPTTSTINPALESPSPISRPTTTTTNTKENTLDFTQPDTPPTERRRDLPVDVLGLGKGRGEGGGEKMGFGVWGMEREGIREAVAKAVRADWRVGQVRKTLQGASRFNEVKEAESILYRYSESYRTIDQLVGGVSLRLSDTEIASDFKQFSDTTNDPEYLLWLLLDPCPQTSDEHLNPIQTATAASRAQNFPMRLRQKLKPKTGGFS